MDEHLSWVATAATIIAASVTASNLGTKITGIGFIIFTIGSIAWLGVGLTTGQPALTWTNIALTGLNLFGVWRWLGWKAGLEKGGAAAAKDSRSEPGETLFPVSLLTSGKAVDSAGEECGRCVDAMAGCASGRLAYVVVSEGGVAGVGEHLRRLPWAGCAVERDEVRAPLARRDFCRLEPLEPGHWPPR